VEAAAGDGAEAGAGTGAKPFRVQLQVQEQELSDCNRCSDKSARFHDSEFAPASSPTCLGKKSLLLIRLTCFRLDLHILTSHLAETHEKFEFFHACTINGADRCDCPDRVH
jgi:hypothetical protein